MYFSGGSWILLFVAIGQDLTHFRYMYIIHVTKSLRVVAKPPLKLLVPPLSVNITFIEIIIHFH